MDVRVGLQRKLLFSSVAQSCLILFDPMNRSMLGFSVRHQLPEFTQSHVHWVCDAIQPSHPLSSPSPPTFHLPQHQDLFYWVSSSHQVAKVLEFQLQHPSFQWILRSNFHWSSLVAQLVKNPPATQDNWVWSLCWEDPLEKRKATQFNFLAWRIPWTV